MSKFFAFGLGYSAQALAGPLAARGWEIAGTVRDPGTLERLKQRGYKMARFADPSDRDGVANLLRGTTHLLHSIPPVAGVDPVLAQFRDQLAALFSLRWVGYLSTVGVYGGSDGAWVDESMKPEPRNARTEARVAAEKEWLAFGEETGCPVQIFRLAGIYGPGRSAFDKLRDGTARRIVKQGQVFNRIHVDDIASTLEASIARPRQGAIYNIADNYPAPPDEVIAYAAELAGLPLPPAVPFEEAELTPMARSFYEGNRRIANHLIKSELGVQLAFPSYREGLAAVLRDSD
ncbi:MAG: SDR family oxidoreductase [Methyloceanibacter sp.]|nr:SDR family oxidoreductase [Methyloceanibacter sp.]